MSDAVRRGPVTTEPDARDVAARFGEAVAYHQAGMLAEAEARYRALLDRSPDHVDSLHMLGVIEHQNGRHRAALLMIDQALAIDATSASVHNNRGTVLSALRRFEEALASYDRAIGLAPAYVDALINHGNVLKELKRFEEALASYDRALLFAPELATVFNKRGVVLTELQRYADAIASFDRALALKPDDPQAFNNRGVSLAKLGRGQEALASYERAIALEPQNSSAHDNRGQTLLDCGRAAEALLSFERAIAIDGNRAELLERRGRALAGLRRYEDALASYDGAIALKPDCAEAYNSRGNTLIELNRLDEALASYDRAIALEPDNALVYYNRGNVLGMMKRLNDAVQNYTKAIALLSEATDAMNNRGNALIALGRCEEALADFDRVIALDSNYADAFNNRGNALKELKRFDEALGSFDRAIALKPDHAEYFNNRAIVLVDLKRYDEAFASYDRAIALKPDYAEAYSNRGFALREIRQLEAASESFAKALELKPELEFLSGVHLHAKMNLCDWAGLDEEYARIVAAIGAGRLASLPFPLLASPVSAAVQRQCAELYSTNKFPPRQPPLWAGERYGHQRIRVAYLSSDLRDHPVAYLTAGLFEHHDRTGFETIAISYKSDHVLSIRRRLETAFDRFVDAHAMSDFEVAKLLRELEVDIAVDLNGYTEGFRPQVLAHRPAPVQVNYLGYAGTLGAANWDYVIADRSVIPPDARHDFVEQVIYLPDCYMVTDDRGATPGPPPSRTELHLPERGFVFCCFNNGFKITPDIFDTWMRILRAVDGSVLWLSATNTTAPVNLCREAEARGVSAKRLVFAARVEDRSQYLARLQLADLFLDTLHYNAHATTSDVLWAGLPILTYMGETFASRVAGSLLTAVGLPELITHSLAGYETLAVALARDPDRNSTLKKKLVDNLKAAPLFDTARFTRHIERAYATMWERAERGDRPESFAVAPITVAPKTEQNR
jgi:protein O-GlcNAc transferase